MTPEPMTLTSNVVGFLMFFVLAIFFRLLAVRAWKPWTVATSRVKPTFDGVDAPIVLTSRGCGGAIMGIVWTLLMIGCLLLAFDQLIYSGAYLEQVYAGITS